MSYAIIVSPEGAMQLLDTTTDRVADLAVLDHTWRPMGEPAPEPNDVSGFLFAPQASVPAGTIAPSPPRLAGPATTEAGTIRPAGPQVTSTPPTVPAGTLNTQTYGWLRLPTITF